MSSLGGGAEEAEGAENCLSGSLAHRVEASVAGLCVGQDAYTTTRLLTVRRVVRLNGKMSMGY